MPRILAVDDQPANLLLVRRVLTAAGFEVREAHSGAEALAVAREASPDLILLDMHLPDMHGLEVLRRLRESEWGGELPVVAMSALSTPEDETLWRRAGCVGTLEKPITVATFPQQVARYLPGATADGAPAGGEARKSDRLGEILLAHQLLTPGQLAVAAAAQAATGKRLGQVLVEEGFVSEDDLAWALSNQLGYPYIFLTSEAIDEEAARLLPEGFLRTHRILPILKFGREMTLAMADPTDQRTVDEVAARTGTEVRRALALASNIDAMLDRLFARHLGTGPGAPAEVQYLQFHLLQALQQQASEIHFDPGIDGQARVRYRLQGTLRDRPAQPTELHTAILQHLRDLTGADDGAAARGSAAVTVGDTEVYLTVAFLPTLEGPAAAVVLHPRGAPVPDPDALGLAADDVAPLRAALGAGRGVVLVGCAAASVRTTLLHALVPPLRGAKIWTLETLPLFRRPTLQQTLLHSPRAAAAHLATAAAARADLILIDDLTEAVRAGFEAARGCAVLGGHPEDGVLDLLAEVLEEAGSALVAARLRAILAARPVRLLCAECREEVPPAAGRGVVYQPRGCEACGFTGFRGQRLLTEIWLPDEPARMLLRAGRVAVALERVARAVGGRMRAQGEALVAQGLTVPGELTGLSGETEWTSPTSSS